MLLNSLFLRPLLKEIRTGLKKQENDDLHLETYILNFSADVAKLADAPDLGSGAARHVGSTPSIRTKKFSGVYYGYYHS